MQYLSVPQQVAGEWCMVNTPLVCLAYWAFLAIALAFPAGFAINSEHRITCKTIPRQR